MKNKVVPKALPGLWRERDGLSKLVRIDIQPTTQGMVVVAKADEPWQTRPELRWQVWPEDLEPLAGEDGQIGE
jgi:putative SOS response-associated peptidase YedK